MKIKLVGTDPKTGKLRLSRKALMPKPEGYVEPEHARAPLSAASAAKVVVATVATAVTVVMTVATAATRAMTAVSAATADHARAPEA